MSPILIMPPRLVPLPHAAEFGWLNCAWLPWLCAKAPSRDDSLASVLKPWACAIAATLARPSSVSHRHPPAPLATRVSPVSHVAREGGGMGLAPLARSR